MLVGLLGAVLVYLPGLSNDLIFDDKRLTDGTIYGVYGGFDALRPRLLSYGSFVWLSSLFGDGWKSQRIFNLAVHLGTAYGLWLLVRGMMDKVSWPSEDETGPSADSKSAAASAGVILFLLNPVAVYAVAYLIQRSILMATFFSVWSLVLTLRAAEGRGLAYLPAGFLLYAMAVLSKEHAVLLPLPGLALYLMVRKPTGRERALIGVVSVVLMALALSFLVQRYGGIVGTTFDANSAEFVAQLERLRPGVSEDAYLLSVINQAWLFFKYGVMWVLPYVGWMSIDQRPPFPLSTTDFPQVLGLPIYLALLIGSGLLMLRYADWRRYLGFALFVPATLFGTEFATVWIQDPFVLYRSYLWAIGMPFLFAFPFVGARPTTVLAIASAISVLFAGLAFERVGSMSGNLSAWDDAARKLSVDGPAAEVGKGRAFMARGNLRFGQEFYSMALQDYDRALQVGELPGLVEYHRGLALQALGQFDAALQAYARAEAAGGTPETKHLLPLQKAQAYFRLKKISEAAAAAAEALATGRLEVAEQKVALDIAAKSHIQLGGHQEALDDFNALLKIDPDNRPARIGMALTLTKLRRFDEAAEALKLVLAEKDGADVRFGRAMLFASMGRAQDALSEAQLALRMKPNDPALRGLVLRLQGGA